MTGAEFRTQTIDQIEAIVQSIGPKLGTMAGDLLGPDQLPILGVLGTEAFTRLSLLQMPLMVVQRMREIETVPAPRSFVAEFLAEAAGHYCKSLAGFNAPGNGGPMEAEAFLSAFAERDTPFTYGGKTDLLCWQLCAGFDAQTGDTTLEKLNKLYHYLVGSLLRSGGKVNGIEFFEFLSFIRSVMKGVCSFRDTPRPRRGKNLTRLPVSSPPPRTPQKPAAKKAPSEKFATPLRPHRP